jgi:hypothetical protein
LRLALPRWSSGARWRCGRRGPWRRHCSRGGKGADRRRWRRDGDASARSQGR